MLVLTRRLGEAIQIGNQIEITVLAIQGDQVKIGINAPKDIEIHRKEVYLTIQQSNNEAASINKDLINQIKNNQFRP